MAEQAVQVDKLDITISDFHILKGIDLLIPAGKVTGLLGPSGAGKTTLVRTIVGLQRITAGSVAVLGKPAGHPKLRHVIGYMAQDPDVYGDLSVKENVHYFARLLNVDSNMEKSVIKDVDLVPQTEQLVSTLSGGQLVRVSLAIALLGKPKLIILDEPTVGLDPVLRQKLWQDFHKLAKRGTTVIVTSHVMDEAQRCDQLVLMHDGDILATSSPKKLQEETDTKDMEGAFLKLIQGAES